jgi:threonine/homoserine/homoserine lactone efflux protein
MLLNARKSSNVILKVHAVENLSFSSIVWQGVWVELLNPKTVLFFALFLPPFVSAGAGEASVQAQLLFGTADRYPVGYCHGIAGAHCDQIHQ